MEEKNQLHSVLSLFLIVVTILLIYSVFWGPLSDLNNEYPQRTITVSASGKTTVKPDIALVSFSLVNEGSQTQAVTDENNKKMTLITSYLKEQGIEDKDIKTKSYNLQPVYTQQPNILLSSSYAPFVPKIAGYKLTQTTEIKVRDFSKISPIMSELVSLGVNKLDNISFSIDDQEKFLAEARADAFKKIEDKVKNIEREADVDIGDIVNISEYSGGGYYPMYESSLAYGKGGDGSSSIAPASIEPGSSEITLNVNIVYELE